MENNPQWKNWLNALGQKPLIIAGPCSAETEEQVLKTAEQISLSGVKIFRAGIWKPRTRPGGFEGVGEKGLPWLKKVKENFGMLIATEVATASHAMLALKYDVDVLWIGARTTTNPFAVQEIANVLSGTNKIVLIKNPVNPDLSLWIGGIERIYASDIKNIGVIHRGFSTYDKTKYRNIPEWQIPLDLQSKFPDLPLICDPSHITGNRNLVQNVSQQALNLNYDGLMIETHINPSEAWSDAPQQITPQSLKNLIKDLIIRKREDNSEIYTQKLEKYRFQIDEIDAKIIDLLGKRLQIAENIGKLKHSYNVALFQNERWQKVQERLIQAGINQGLSEEFMNSICKAIHQESIDRQEKIVSKKI